MITMRASKLLTRLRAGEIVCSVKLNSADPRVVEIAAMSGFDVIWMDMEHVPTDWSTIETAVRAAKIYDSDIMVRVARGSYSDYIRALEADAAGLMIPHIMNVSDAEQVIRNTRFHPIGRRPIDGGNPDGAYCLIDVESYVRDANLKRFICVQIEDPEALDHLESIARLDGLDIIFFGPADFAHALGVPGKYSDPRVIDAKRRVPDMCKRYGKFAGTVGSPDDVLDLVAMGYRFINVAADVIGLGQYFRRILEQSTAVLHSL